MTITITKRKRASKPSHTSPPSKKKRGTKAQMAYSTTEEAPRNKVPRSPRLRDRISMSNTVNSPLLQLPAEIRNLIFFHVFSGSNYELAYIWSPTGQVLTSNNADLRQLCVCRQLHAETAMLHYKLGTFNIEYPYIVDYEFWRLFDRFLKARTEEQISAMACVKLIDWKESDADFYETNSGTGAYWVAKLVELLGYY